MLTARDQSRFAAVPRRPLLWLAVAGAVGIVADRWLGGALAGWGLFTWWLAALVCLGLTRLPVVRCATSLSAFALLLAAACVFASWHHLHWRFFAADQLGRAAAEVPEPVCVEAVAVDRIHWSPAPAATPLRAIPMGPRSELAVDVVRVRDGENWRNVSGRCRLRVQGELRDVMVGDRLRVFALFGKSSSAMNPGEYDWAAAGRGAGRHFELYCKVPECISVVEPAVSKLASRGMHRVGERFEQRLAHYIWPEQRDLAQAILLGASERLGDEDYEAFLRTGTIHLLVVSGLHVGLLALAIWAVVSSGLFPRQTGLLLTVGLVVGYAWIVGGRPPVLRASMLVVLTLLSFATGRRVQATNLLAAAALIVLAVNPSELFRSGTQLSFLCVATLAAYGSVFQQHSKPDPLQRLIQQTRPWHQKLVRRFQESFRHTALASLAVWLVAAPLVAYHFHISSPVSVVITPLLWPLVAIALITGMSVCGVAWLLPPLAQLLGFVCSLCLWLTQLLVRYAHQFELGSFYLPGPSLWWLLVFYLVLGAFALLPARGWDWKLPVSFAAVWLAAGLVVAGPKNDNDSLRCTFLSVGHGTCVVLQLPGGETILYDAGSLGSPEHAARVIAGYLWSEGIIRVDAVVLSHADVDHYNALPGLLERFDVGRVIVSPLMFSPWINDGLLEAPNFLRQTLAEAEVPLREVWMNDRLRTSSENLSIEVLHPPRQGVVGQDNANSLLLAVRFAGRSILLPGDLEAAGIEAVTAERPQAFDILLAPHHGSRNSDPPGFAAWCTPKWVVISGPPLEPEEQYTAASYRDIGAKVMHTANSGALEFKIQAEGITMDAFRLEREQL